MHRIAWSAFVRLRLKSKPMHVYLARCLRSAFDGSTVYGSSSTCSRLALCKPMGLISGRFYGMMIFYFIFLLETGVTKESVGDFGSKEVDQVV